MSKNTKSSNFPINKADDKPLKWFYRLVLCVVGFYALLFFFFGGLNALLRTDVWQGRIQKLIEKEVSAKDAAIQVNFDVIESELHGFFPPRLSMNLKKISIERPPYKIEADFVQMRLSWKSLLFKQKLKLQRVFIDRLEAQIESNVTGKIEQKITLLKVFSNDLIAEENPVLEGRFFWSGLEGLEGNTPELLARVVKSDKNVTIEIKGRWQEGEVLLVGDLQNKEIKAKLEHISIASIARVVENFLEEQNKKVLKGFVEAPGNWLTCSVNFKIGNKAVKEQKLEVRDCLLEGELGKIQSNEVRLEKSISKELSLIEPAIINLEGVGLERILSLLSVDILKGVLSEFGELSGALNIQSNQDVTFKGGIEKIFVAFSRQGQRGRQHIPFVKGELGIKEGRIVGALEEMEVLNGSFKGTMSFNFDRGFRNGFVQLGIDELGLDQNIQTLLAEGKVDPFSVYGKIKVKDGLLDHWDGVFGVNSIINSEITLNKVKIDSLFKGKLLRLNVKSESGSFNLGSLYPKLLKPVFLRYLRPSSLPAEEADKKNITWKNLNVDFLLRESAILWKKGHGEIESIKLSSEGFLFNDGRLKGWLNVIGPKKSAKTKWDISGSKEKPFLALSYDSLKKRSKKSVKKDK